MISLTIDLANHKYIKIQPLDSHNAAIGLPDVIFPFHLKSIGPALDGKGIAIDKKGGYVSGVKRDEAFIISYADIALYNAASPPSLSVIFNDFLNCIIGEEGS